MTRHAPSDITALRDLMEQHQAFEKEQRAELRRDLKALQDEMRQSFAEQRNWNAKMDERTRFLEGVSKGRGYGLKVACYILGGLVTLIGATAGFLRLFGIGLGK